MYFVPAPPILMAWPLARPLALAYIEPHLTRSS